jgi:aryl carrier-like protein
MRCREDGSYDIIGRTGTQVKIRGQRVELGEVEYHVREHFESAAKVVADMVIPASDSTATLVAFVLLHSSENRSAVDGPILAPPSECFRASAQAAGAALSTMLPRYLLPDLYVELTRIPLTITGKTSRKELRRVVSERTREELNAYMELRQEHRMPSTRMERILHGVFAKALDVDPSSIGIDDSFFRLGGDSIIAMQASMLCRKQKVHLTIQDLFRRRTIAELARHIRGPGGNPRPDAALEPFSLSCIQQSFLQSVPAHQRNGAAQKLFLRLEGSADVDTVRHAVSDIVERHPSLRTRFHQLDDGQWRQQFQVHSSVVFGWHAELIADTTEIPRLVTQLQRSLCIRGTGLHGGSDRM